MIGQPAPAAAPAPGGFSAFWNLLGRLTAEFLNKRGWGSIIVQIEDGKVKRVHINQSFEPGQIPRI